MKEQITICTDSQAALAVLAAFTRTDLDQIKVKQSGIAGLGKGAGLLSGPL